MAQMLVRVTEEMDEALKDFAELVGDKTDGDNLTKLVRIEKDCHDIMNGVYEQWKGSNYNG